MSHEDIAKKYDTATPEEIKKWQADSPMEWIWESYQASSKIYAEIKPGQDIDGAYYDQHIALIHLRIEQAGVRLAGELNRIFANERIKVTRVTLAPPPPLKADKPILTPLEDVKNAIGNTVTTTGKVYGAKDIGSMVLVNLGATYPNQLLTIAIKGEAKAAASNLDGKTVSVTGLVIDYKGRPEIVVSDSAQIMIKPEPWLLILMPISSGMFFGYIHWPVCNGADVFRYL